MTRQNAMIQFFDNEGYCTLDTTKEWFLLKNYMDLTVTTYVNRLIAIIRKRDFGMLHLRIRKLDDTGKGWVKNAIKTLIQRKRYHDSGKALCNQKVFSFAREYLLMQPNSTFKNASIHYLDEKEEEMKLCLTEKDKCGCQYRRKVHFLL